MPITCTCVLPDVFLFANTQAYCLYSNHCLTVSYVGQCSFQSLSERVRAWNAKHMGLSDAAADEWHPCIPIITCKIPRSMNLANINQLVVEGLKIIGNGSHQLRALNNNNNSLVSVDFSSANPPNCKVTAGGLNRRSSSAACTPIELSLATQPNVLSILIKSNSWGI